jgi:hypothetical protein
MDPHLKNSPRFFDGEKLLLEFCGLLLIAASVKRYMYYLKKIKTTAGISYTNCLAIVFLAKHFLNTIPAI